MPCPLPTVLSDADRALYQTRLTEAEAQYHALMTGTAVATLRDQNGESITYTIANVDKLGNYISYLKTTLGVAGTRSRPPMRVFMGR